MKKSLIVFAFLFALVSCAKGQNKKSDSQSASSEISDSTTSESEIPMSEYGDLIIKDVPFLYYDMGPMKLDITFTKEEYKETITYKYQTSLFKIEDDSIIPLKNGSTTAFVTATTSHHSTRFKVNMPSVNSDRYNRAIEYENEIKTKVDDKTTIFLGDSVFDVKHFWKNFYTEVTGNRYICGISSSTIEEWGLYASHILRGTNPKMLVWHIGTNDFWDSSRPVEVVKNEFKCLIEFVHSIIPNTKIVVCSVENRSSKMSQTIGMDDTIKILKEYDAFVQDYVKNHTFMGYINSIAHFCNEDWTLKTELTKDGIHPNNSEYAFYVNEAKKLGAEIDLAE